jgi:glycosyltransferase involved in cell wall biosynthesis
VAGDDDRERLSRLEAKIAALEAALGGQASSMSDLQQEMSQLSDRIASHTEWLTTLERWVSSCVKTLANFGAQPLDSEEPSSSGSIDVTGSLMARLEVATVMDWVTSVAQVPEGPTVTVTIATRNRPKILLEAIDSVLQQSYQRFDLVVVDDSDSDETQDLLAGLNDKRIRSVRTPERRGAGAAFNAGLEAASGDIIAFLDDDNLLHRHWLRSVVWAFTAFPEVDALYGARSNEDPGARLGERSGMLPTLEFAHYDRARHERANYVDRNTIAFRSFLKDIRYDETLRAAFDWDHSLRLFARAEPLALPALSCYYRTLVPDRVSDIPEQRESVVRVRSRVHATRELRVLVHTEMYPVIPETYIGEDIRALEQAGAVVTVSAVLPAVSRAAGVPDPLLDVDGAIEQSRPDVVLMHWSTHAVGQLPQMESHNQPFACRVHSFDIDSEIVRQLIEHPLCVAVFAHPNVVDQLPLGVIPLLPTVNPKTVIPESPPERSLVLSVSAALPKKDFPFLVRAFASLPEFERAIILGRSNGFEEVPATVEKLVAEADPMIAVWIDVPRPDVLDQLARASVLVYTLEPGKSFGYPMSIVEAMLCGTIPITPDVPQARSVVGPNVRTYRVAEDIVRHTREVAAGGAKIERERAELVTTAQRHRDPAALTLLHDLLRDKLTEWRVPRS